MSVQVEQLSPFQKRLQFTVPVAEVNQRLEAAFKNLAHRVNMPGFRKGKAPRKVLEARFGRAVRNEVASDIMNYRFREATLDMTFIGQPEVEQSQLQDGQDFTFSVLVQVKPEVALTDYKGIRIDYPAPEVSEVAVEAQIQRRLVGLSKLEEVAEGRAAEAGDLVMAELVALVDGEEKLLESGTMVNTRGDRYYPGVESLVVGLKTGESATGAVRIGEANTLPSHKGQNVDVRVKVLGIQVSKVPALSDEVATQLGYEGGVEAMRAALRMEEEQRANEVARNQARVNLLQALNRLNPVEVPPAMVESHTAMLKEELRIQNSYRGKDARNLRFTEAQEADLRERGLFAARSALLLEAVAKTEGIEVTDEDLDAKYQEIADLRGQRVEAIRGYFQKDNAVEELRKRLLEERTLEWLLEAAELNYVGGGDTAPAAEAAPAEAAPAEAAPAAEAAPEAPAAEAAPAKKSRKKKTAEPAAE